MGIVSKYKKGPPRAKHMKGPREQKPLSGPDRLALTLTYLCYEKPQMHPGISHLSKPPGFSYKSGTQ